MPPVLPPARARRGIGLTALARRHGNARGPVLGLGILLGAALLPGCRSDSASSTARRLEIEPVQQAPGLCGVCCGEMILRYYGVERVGPGGRYRISERSGGSALGQEICDRLDQGTAAAPGQPRCIDGDQAAILVYAGGAPTRRTREAYPRGTWLANVQAVLREHGIQSRYVPSIRDADDRYVPDQVGPRFDALLDHVRRGYPAIIHVAPRLTRADSHFLLVHGYDDAARELHYIDPNPIEDAPRRDDVDYAIVRSGQPWFRGRYFFTGRYLAVTGAPAR